MTEKSRPDSSASRAPSNFNPQDIDWNAGYDDSFHSVAADNCNTEGIPQQMKALSLWVGYRLIPKPDGEKSKKVPVSLITGESVNPADPANGVSFDEAMASEVDCDGLGFIFSEEAGIVGVDLDECRNPETGEITSEAAEIVACLSSYTEESPSGTGVHVYVYGKKPRGRCRKGGVEMYNRGRFFTVTGKHVSGTATTVEQRDDELKWLYDATFSEDRADEAPHALPAAVDEIAVERLILDIQSDGGNKDLKALFEGKWQDLGYGSQSEADMALLGHIGRLTNSNKGLSCATFLRSGLGQREKAQRKDYLERTWERLCEQDGPEQGTSEDAALQASDLSPIRVSEFMRCNPAPLVPVVDDCIDMGTKTCIVAPSKARKSTFVMQMGIAIADGHDEFLGMNIPDAKTVLYINLEVPEGAVLDRLGWLCPKEPLKPQVYPENLWVINARGYEFGSGWAGQVIHWIKECKAQVVIIDPLYKLIDGDENSAKDVKGVLKKFDRVCRETGAALIYVSHTAKGGGRDRNSIDMAVGSSVIARDFDTQIALREHSEDDCLIVETIARSHRSPDAFCIRFDECRFVLAPELPVRERANGLNAPSPAEEDALEAVTRAMSSGEIERLFNKQVGFSQVEARAVKDSLIADGKLVKRPNGRGYLIGRPEHFPDTEDTGGE